MVLTNCLKPSLLIQVLYSYTHSCTAGVAYVGTHTHNTHTHNTHVLENNFRKPGAVSGIKNKETVLKMK